MVKAPAGGSCFPLLVKILLLTVFLVNSDHFCIWILVQLHFGRLPQLMSSLEHQNFPEKPEILVVWEQNSRRNTFSRFEVTCGRVLFVLAQAHGDLLFKYCSNHGYNVHFECEKVKAWLCKLCNRAILPLLIQGQSSFGGAESIWE